MVFYTVLFAARNSVIYVGVVDWSSSVAVKVVICEIPLYAMQVELLFRYGTEMNENGRRT